MGEGGTHSDPVLCNGVGLLKESAFQGNHGMAGLGHLVTARLSC